MTTFDLNEDPWVESGLNRLHDEAFGSSGFAHGAVNWSMSSCTEPAAHSGADKCTRAVGASPPAEVIFTSRTISWQRGWMSATSELISAARGHGPRPRFTSTPTGPEDLIFSKRRFWRGCRTGIGTPEHVRLEQEPGRSSSSRFLGRKTIFPVGCGRFFGPRR